MKRLLSFMLAILLAFTFVSCAEPETPKFTVTFEGIEHSPVVVNAGEKFKLPTDLPPKDGHVLVVNMGDTVLEAGKEYEITADTVLKCSWKQSVFTVTFDGITHDSVKVNEGEKFKLPATLPTNDGYQLIVKMGDEVLVAGQEYAITADTVLKCSWEYIPVYLTENRTSPEYVAELLYDLYSNKILTNNIDFTVLPSETLEGVRNLLEHVYFSGEDSSTVVVNDADVFHCSVSGRFAMTQDKDGKIDYDETFNGYTGTTENYDGRKSLVFRKKDKEEIRSYSYLDYTGLVAGDKIAENLTNALYDHFSAYYIPEGCQENILKLKNEDGYESYHAVKAGDKVKSTGSETSYLYVDDLGWHYEKSTNGKMYELGIIADSNGKVNRPNVDNALINQLIDKIDIGLWEIISTDKDVFRFNCNVNKMDEALMKEKSEYLVQLGFTLNEDNVFQKGEIGVVVNPYSLVYFDSSFIK